MRRKGKMSRASGMERSTVSWLPPLAKVLFGTWTLVCAMFVPTVAGRQAEQPVNCGNGLQPPCKEQVVALKENSAAVRALTAGMAEATDALDDLQGSLEVAAIHRRLSDIELLLHHWRPTSCAAQQCGPTGDAAKCCAGCAAEKTAAFDTIGPCVRREKVGEFEFASGSIEVMNQAEVARVAKLIEEELRYVFAVGYGDAPSFSWANIGLGLKRARVVADALTEELVTISANGSGNQEGSDTKPENIRAVSGVEWVPTTSHCSSSGQGKVAVYLVWHGRSELCKSGPAVGM